MPTLSLLPACVLPAAPFGNRWQVCISPVTVPAGQRLIAIAPRLGYKTSNRVEVITDSDWQASQDEDKQT